MPSDTIIFIMCCLKRVLIRSSLVHLLSMHKAKMVVFLFSHFIASLLHHLSNSCYQFVLCLEQDLSPYLPSVIPGLKTSLLDPVPEVIHNISNNLVSICILYIMCILRFDIVLLKNPIHLL